MVGAQFVELAAAMSLISAFLLPCDDAGIMLFVITGPVSKKLVLTDHPNSHRHANSRPARDT
ncbi:hypothetical protein ACH41H_42085 [Streptomyces sp. NPDC020800]|uniref:hypothetical protein n=1 Tax=Streptomyces sp. NPDC020800 TaxID=3365092 RepID=UPI0037B58278